MSKHIETLLNGQAVQWRTLGEVGTFVRGSGLQKKDLTTSGVPAIHYGQIYTHYGTHTHQTKSFVTQDFARKARKAQAGSLIIATTSENDDDVCKAVAWLGEGEVVVSSDACYYTHSLDPKYVAYYFRTELFQEQKRGYITGTKVRRVNASDLAKITIPIPPMRVQERIVEVLDAFSALTAELEAELEGRRRQYAHYREQLLALPDAPRLPLGEVAKIKNGKDYKHLGTGSVPVYGSGGIMTYVDTPAYNKPTVLIPRKGSLKNLFYLESAFWNVDTIFYTEVDEHTIIPKFLYYSLSLLNLEELNQAGGVPSLTQAVLNTLPIPIPPLEEQRRIVEILDRFSTLCESITEGLPREIELRRKQYGYYREQLLTL